MSQHPQILGLDTTNPQLQQRNPWLSHAPRVSIKAALKRMTFVAPRRAETVAKTRSGAASNTTCKCMILNNNSVSDSSYTTIMPTPRIYKVVQRPISSTDRLLPIGHSPAPCRNHHASWIDGLYWKFERLVVRSLV